MALTKEQELLQNMAAMLKRAFEYADTLHTETGQYTELWQETAQLHTHVRELLREAESHRDYTEAEIKHARELQETGSTEITDLVLQALEASPSPDWRAIEKQAEIDLAAIQTDADAYRFIERYLSAELRIQLMKIYQSDRREMGRSPQEAVKNLLSLPPL